ncbi:MAG: Gfo/Idh/MocA family oxidoreductase [Planctomycetota bacterium]
MADKLGFGLIGYGLVAPFHAKALADSRKADLIAVAGRNPDKTRAFCKTHGGQALDRIDAIYRRDDIHVVVVLTPNASHEEYAVNAARAGKHVLVEKPPEMTLEKTDHIIRACRENHVKLGIVLQCRFRKAIEAIKTAIAGGRFGRLLHGDAFMKWFRPVEYYHRDPWRSSRAEGGGVIIQHAFHYFDLLHHLMGPVGRVHARTANLMHPDVDLEDTVLAFFNYANGAQGVLEASTALFPGTDIRIEINGEKGTAIMQGERITTWQFQDDRPEDEAIRKIGSAEAQTAAGGAAAFGHYEHRYLIDDMVDAIREDREPRVTGESARGTLEIALAMYQSADEGRPVALPL